MPAEEVFFVEGTVLVVILEFHQAQLRTSDGHMFAITRRTVGLDYAELRDGDRVRCEVTRALPRVLRAWRMT